MAGTSWMFQQQTGAGAGAAAQEGDRKRRRQRRAAGAAARAAAEHEQEEALGFLTRLSVRAPPAAAKPRRGAAASDASDESSDEAGGASGRAGSPKAVQPLAYAAVGALSVYYGIKGILGVRPCNARMRVCRIACSPARRRRAAVMPVAAIRGGARAGGRGGGWGAAGGPRGRAWTPRAAGATQGGAARPAPPRGGRRPAPAAVPHGRAAWARRRAPNGGQTAAGPWSNPASPHSPYPPTHRP